MYKEVAHARPRVRADSHKAITHIDLFQVTSRIRFPRLRVSQNTKGMVRKDSIDSGVLQSRIILIRLWIRVLISLI